MTFIASLQALSDQTTTSQLPCETLLEALARIIADAHDSRIASTRQPYDPERFNLPLARFWKRSPQLNEDQHWRQAADAAEHVMLTCNIPTEVGQMATAMDAMDGPNILETMANALTYPGQLTQFDAIWRDSVIPGRARQAIYHLSVEFESFIVMASTNGTGQNRLCVLGDQPFEAPLSLDDDEIRPVIPDVWEVNDQTVIEALDAPVRHWQDTLREQGRDSLARTVFLEMGMGSAASDALSRAQRHRRTTPGMTAGVNA